METELNKEK